MTGNTTDFDAHTFRIGEKTWGIPNVTGNITDFRISSTARYTAEFTPATASLTSDGDTSLLLTMQGAKILDKSQSIQTISHYLETLHHLLLSINICLHQCILMERETIFCFLTRILEKLWRSLTIELLD